MSFSIEQIQSLPKVDLHVHLDGSLRLETMIDIAQKEGISLPAESAHELKKVMRCGERVGSLETYLKAFEITLRVMQSKSALTRIAYELGKDAAKENIRYMEVRYAPFLSRECGLDLDSIVEAILTGFRQANNDFGIVIRFIVCGLRHLSPSLTMDMAKLAVTFKEEGVVALDLAGPEDGYPVRDHEKAFVYAKTNGLNVTIHAGEAHPAVSIKEALDYGLADRIGHGCTLFEDAALSERILSGRVAIESCPSSNVQTGAVLDLHQHPLKNLLRAGHRVSVHTDNRLITDTTVSQELFHCQQFMQLEKVDLCQLIRNGFSSAFISEAEKQTFLNAFEDSLPS